MLSFCIINIVSYKGLIRFNFVLFLFKVTVIVLVVITFIKTRFHTANFSDLGQTTVSLTGWQAILTAVASGGVAFAFTGFKHGVELAGETKRLALAIPLAVVGSIMLITYLDYKCVYRY